MRVQIEHSTIYRYDYPVWFSAQYLRLTPPVNASQRPTRWSIDVKGRLTPWTDGFGNICHTLVSTEQVDEIRIVARGMVETTDTAGMLPHESPLPLGAFLRPTPLTLVDDAVVEFAGQFRDATDADPLEGMHQLSAALADSVEYREGESHVHSTASDALHDGFGVCQDMAHLFIACARALGVPARYVSGYLHTGDDGAPHAASHAWASAWIEGFGWVSFDVANRKCGTEEHISLAVALDYAGAAPVRGVRRGGSEDEMMDIQVRVTQA